MEELNNVQAAADDSAQEEKSAFPEGDYYYDKENEEVKFGDKTLGMKWFGFYRWFWMGIGGLVQLISIVVMIVTGTMKETIGEDVSSWIYVATPILVLIPVACRLMLWFFLPKFTKTVYKVNLIWLILMPLVNLSNGNLILWIRDCIVSLLNVVYFQKRSFMFGIKKEECREKYRLKRLAGPAAALILPLILILVGGIAANAADEKAAIVNAEEDYKTLAQTVGFDSTQEQRSF